jgi:alanine racemase
VTAGTPHPTRVLVHADRLAHNLELLRKLAGGAPVWPAVKANAYGHGAVLVARQLVALGCETLCVAHAREAIALSEAGVRARFVLLSAALPDASEAIVAHDLEPAVCTLECVEALARSAARAGRRLHAHLKVDTGMGRIGVRPEDVAGFLERSREFPALHVRGLMSHFPRADEGDATYSKQQLGRFLEVVAAARQLGVEVVHMANSAALFDLPEARLDAVRPGIALYGLPPSPAVANPLVAELRPVLEWRTRISFVKEVPAGVGLSYGHTFRTARPTLVATLPVGYGDGLSRRLSNRLEVLVGGRRCPQLGTITMDQCLIDVTALRGRVSLGDEVVLLGSQGAETLHAGEWAQRLGTISYEVLTAIAERVPRVAVSAAPRG